MQEGELLETMKKQEGTIGRLLGAIEALVEKLRGPSPMDPGFRAIEASHATRDAVERVRIERSVPLFKVSEEQRLVGGVVYEPDVADAHGDAMTAAQIMKAAHGFMARYAQLESETGTDHLQKVGRGQLVVVESYVAPTDFTLGGQKVTKGSWVMLAKVLDNDLWAAVKNKQFTGWSFEGYGYRRPVAA